MSAILMRGSVHRKQLLGLGFVLILLGGQTTNVSAIPAFARKYQTSCQTCHIAFPALNPVGEAFRLNGYRFPAAMDDQIKKDQPVSLGAEGYKKLWPEAVWPGEIPGLPPIAFETDSRVENDRTSKSTAFEGLGGEAYIRAGGTLGNHASFFGSIGFEREGDESSVEMDRLVLLLRPSPSPAFQFKIGAFEPGLLLVSDHRRLADEPFFILNQTAGDNEWAAEPFQQGIEFFGVAAHRILYNAGYVEGAGNLLNNAKDYYGRVAYKFGGLSLDGASKGAGNELTSSPKPWSERSLTVSAFAYKGYPLLGETTTTLINDPNTNIVTPVETTVSQTDDFKIYGGDVAWNFDNLIVHAGAAERTDRRPDLSDPTETDVKVKDRFAEVDWVAYPWLIPAARWESFDEDGAKTERISLTINVLVRANVKSFVAADSMREPGGNYKTEKIVGGVTLAF